MKESKSDLTKTEAEYELVPIPQKYKAKTAIGSYYRLVILD
ncbi:MAG TPA: hypothetical protein VJ729_11425 [Nitrososphaeraceae archaeon]|nr:hypothetical protein [Nitrososphaeraceae archaeon]